MELKSHTIGFKGEYSATVLKADGTVKEFLNEEKTLRSGDVIKNLLLDNFFERLIGTTNYLFPFTIRCGTGSNAVVPSQNSLTNQLELITGSWPTGTTNSVNGFIEDGKLKSHRTFTFMFDIGQITGNISELGVNINGTPTSSNNLVHSRALVVDNLGQPTSISVTASEQLIINYTLRLEMDATDLVVNSNMLINGVSTPVQITTRVLAGGPMDGYIHAGIENNQLFFASAFPSSGQPNLNIGYVGMPTFQHNVDGAKLIVANIPTNTGNSSNGVGCMAFIPTRFIWGFNPPIPKNADRTLSITIRHTFGRLP